MTAKDDDLLTVSEAAAYRGVEHSTILKAIQSGRLPSVAGFRGYLVRRPDVDALVIRSHPSRADSPYVSIAEAAALLGVTRQWVHHLVAAGRLGAAPDARTDGRQSAAVRLRRADVEAFAAARQEAATRSGDDEQDEGE